MANWYHWEEHAGGSDLLLHVLLQPKARNNQITGIHADALKIRLTAPPVDGKANQQLCSFLAGLCGVSKSRVQLENGQSSRQKWVRIRLDEAQLPTGLTEF